MIFDLYWRHGVAPDYIADVYVQNRNPKPTVRVTDNLKLMGGKPSFCVLCCTKLTRSFEGGNPKHASSADCYDLVLIDGSHVAFPAHLPS